MASSSSGGRTSKELKMIISASNRDVEDMEESLNKLKELSREDKTEAAMLRARIDEQSQLICVLKRRADEALARAQTLERVNRDLEMFRESAQALVEAEVARSARLERRFGELAENHEEMIRFKDEHKAACARLQRENERLRAENAGLFSAALTEREARIGGLQARVSSLEEERARQGQVISQLQTSHHDKTKEMDNKISQLERQLSEALKKLKGAQVQLRQQSEDMAKADSSQSLRLEKLSKEKEEMLELAMHRGKLIQDKQKEIRELNGKVTVAEREVQRMQEKFERETAAVSANLQVIRLREENDHVHKTLRQINLEYDAYKKHSSKLLAKEKSLNSQLRNLVS